MKKLAIGCAIVLLLVIVVGGVAGYIFLWRPFKATVASFAQLGQIAEIDKQVANRSSFAPPSGNVLTQEMVTRFVGVQEQMQQSLGPQFAEIKTKYDRIDRIQKAEHREASMTEALEAWKDIISLVVLAKRAQVEALNKAGFSLDEYSWVRARVYNAAGIPMSEVDLARLSKGIESGQMSFEKTMPLNEEVPEANKALVKPFAKRLEEWAPLAFFGL